jgi:predicted AAA+ superfamily ATPase
LKNKGDVDQSFPPGPLKLFAGLARPGRPETFSEIDTGVVRTLQNRAPVRAGTPEFGEFFETYIFHELQAYCHYSGVTDLAYWRSQSGFEVDFILAGKTAIEVKGGKTIWAHDLKGLKALMEFPAPQEFTSPLIC